MISYVKDNRGRVKWAGLLLALALVVTGCNDFFFETPEFDNPHDPKNAGPDDPINDPDDLAAALEYREMVAVPGGTFTQEDTGGQSFNHTISIFEIARYQVTYELWYTVRVWAETNGYVFANRGHEGNDGTIGAVPTAEAEHEPVTTVSWRDSIVWLNAYSEMEGLTPVYYADAGYNTAIRESSAVTELQDNQGQIDNPHVNWDANGYRLPTEGEWQYAASYRDGTDWTPFNHASGATDDFNNAAATGAVAWYFANSDTGEGRKTQTVGTKTANELGIHDMSGNVWEWAWDWHAVYLVGAQTDYRGPTTGTTGRVVRGGSWGGDAVDLLVGYRSSFGPWGTVNSIGFRPARTVP